jgi:uncharacterized lipoprotein YddW (UPF0748 family)
VPDLDVTLAPVRPAPARLAARTPLLAAATIALALAACSRVTPPPPPPAPAPEAPVALEPPPPLEREFRGVWVATVSNIDWPSKRGLPVEQQKQELLAILDRAAELKLNAVIFQVRTAGDALYASELEPWSEYLSGVQGKAPEPFYDPLEFAVTEAHRRGLELHAWFNPYRARHPSARSADAPTHLGQTRPDIVHRYGTHLWMDPGEPAVQDHTTRVVLDVVTRYDVDGVHIDDYFYPYRERDRNNKEIPFPDDASWKRYRASGGTLSRDDWRRNNVDRLIERVYREIKQTKPWVKFGISPFGIWRPGYPAQIGGFDAYEQLYADSRKWLNEGWVDYFTPQLYWPIERTAQSFPVLLDWWAGENTHARHLWPGSHTNLAAATKPSAGWSAEEIVRQIEIARSRPAASGHVHFSMRSLMNDSSRVVPLLAGQSYRDVALVPASPWLSSGTPAAPLAAMATDEAPGGAVRAVRLQLRPAPSDGPEPQWWVVRALYDGGWQTRVVPATQHEVVLQPHGTAGAPARVVVSAVDRAGVESAIVEVGREG